MIVLQTFQNFQVKYIKNTKNFKWIVWNMVVAIKCMLLNFGWKWKKVVS